MTMTVNGKTSSANIINSNSIALDATTSKIKTSVNGVEAVHNAIRLVNSSGATIAVAFSES
jgi:hypothetical protein